MEYLMQTLVDIVHAAITIAVWELFAKDFITWDGGDTPFRRKNRKPNAPHEPRRGSGVALDGVVGHSGGQP